MSSQTRQQRGDGNGLDLRTLVIASIAAAVAAVVVSRVWTAGTPIAAAATPVIVTILKELLDRPTAKVADRLTTTTTTQVSRGTEPGDVRVYRQQPAIRRSRRVKPKVVAITAAIAFVIAGVVLTGGQLLAGNPFGSNGTGTIILGQHKAGKKKTVTQTETEQQTQTVTEQQTTPQQQTVTEPQQQATTPTQQTETTTTPTGTTPAPSK